MKNQMRGNPVNTVMLRHYMKTNTRPGDERKMYRGKKLYKIDFAKALGITYPTLQRKLAGDAEMTLWEAKTIADMLELTRDERDAIFFGDVL